MASPNYRESHHAFLKIFRSTAPYKHRYEVFRDFVIMSACSLHNALRVEQKREDEYLGIITGYKNEDQKRFPELLGILIQLLEHEPKDVLGQLYMELEIGNKNQGQFFTPPLLSDLMVQLTFSDLTSRASAQEFITVSEPACGAGGMVLSLVKLFIQDKVDPAQKMWVQCIDVDRMVALMCYVQLTLWNVPAQVLVGNTLSLEMRESWYTPAHHMGFWDSKLRRDSEVIDVSADEIPASKTTNFDATVPQEQIAFEF